MSGAWIKTLERPHECRMPRRGKNWTGSLWRCECGRVWELHVYENYAGRPNDEWRPMEPAKRP